MIKGIICAALIGVSFYLALGQDPGFFPMYCLGMIGAYLIGR